MRFANVVVVMAALAPLAQSHGGLHLPKILGLDLMDRSTEGLTEGIKIGGLFGAGPGASGKSVLEARKDDRECGEGIGSCPQDKCCSISGCTRRYV